MKKVLIVDDEVLSIEYMKRLSAWEKYGCEQIDSAWISSKALECFRKEKHPVVFMDIRMPGMDGLALSREFFKIAPDTVIVIMTAWQEFEYVKEAMQIGVKYFLVKHEITEEKLDEVLGKISEDIRLRENYQRALWNNWLRGLWEAGVKEEIPGKGKNPYFLVMITLRGLSVVLGEKRATYIDETQIRDLQVPRITVRAFSKLESFTYGLLCEYSPALSERSRQEEQTAFLTEVEKICQECTGLKPVLFLSGLKNSAHEFSDLCVKLKNFAHSILWSRKELVCEPEFLQYERLEPGRLTDKIPEEWDKSELQQLLDKGRQNCFFIELSSLTSVKKFLQCRVDTAFLREQEKKNAQISVEQLLRSALSFLENGGMQKSRMVQQAVEYIRIHYSEDISSTLIAETLHVSDGYLRTMFKKELSCTIKDYILQYRIERSKELLLKDGKKIYEIAAQCGFVSSQHFSRVFRQVTGMTPGEYKQR